MHSSIPSDRIKRNTFLPGTTDAASHRKAAIGEKATIKNDEVKEIADMAVNFLAEV